MPDRKDLLPQAYQLGDTKEVAEFYDEWAATYDEELVEANDYVAPMRLAQSFAEHAGRKDLRIIDIGCGTGLAGQALHALGFTRLDGLDLSPGMLAKARAKGVYDALIEGDMTKRVPVDDATYEAAVSAGAFSHSHIGPIGFDEILRIVKPGALICANINADAYERDGYEAKFATLTETGAMRIASLHDTDYIIKTGVRGKLLIAHAG
ncbi:MAG: methyltransferase domain-containing protein [Alphaproteobacteria bacterium]|nr:methyltransferase domain-containing protein [Alphaproteobacteria bacterium]